MRKLWVGLGLALTLLASAHAAAGDWEKGLKQAARLHKQGKLKAAEASLLKTLLTAEAFGEADPRLAYTLDYLGTLNMQMGQADKAVPMLERAVRAFTASRGAQSAETWESMARLAEAHEALAQYAKAEPLYHQLAATGRGDALVQSSDWNNLALSIDAQGRLDESLPLYRKALLLREGLQGPQGAGLAEILNNLGRVYYLKGDFAQAEPLYRRAILLDEHWLKPGDPQLADDYRRLAALIEKRGKRGP